MIPFSRSRKMLALLAVGMACTFVSVDYADARRGGGFGSRGVRTFQAPPPTNTAPRQTAPIERSATPRTQAPAAQAQRPNAQAQRQGLFGGFGGTMMRGLLLGGLLGLLMGYGFGGLAGLFGLLLQVGLVVLAVMLVMRFMRSRQQPAYAGAGAPMRREHFEHSPRGVDLPAAGSGAGAAAGASMAAGPQDEIGIVQDDLDSFERILGEIQTAFANEDFEALRQRTTPEIMAYLAEELSRNATRGVRNEVRDVRLLQGDLAESWREGETEYATVAMRFESIDVTRDRQTGAVVEGDPERPTETTEVWTFVRRPGEDWRVSAIQDA